MSTTAIDTQVALNGTLNRSASPPRSAGVQVTDYDNRQTVGKITVDNPNVNRQMV